MTLNSVIRTGYAAERSPFRVANACGLILWYKNHTEFLSRIVVKQVIDYYVKKAETRH
jgi:hypothetical protein